MNKVTFMDHSGYVVTLDNAILVFDYYRDPAHALHHAIRQNPDMPVIFFVTHHRREHFNKSIFELAQNHKRVYVLSNDVYQQDVPSDLAVAGMSKGDIIEDLPAGIKVHALPATDSGVSFLVTTATGETIFFAGGINDPHKPVTDHHKAADEYNKTLNRIASEMPQADIAFLSVNYLMESDYPPEVRKFLDMVKVRDFFPMELGGNFHDSEEMQSQMPSGTKVHCLHTPGQSVSL